MTDLILFNANIITLDPKVKKAQLVAIHNSRIQAVAKNTEIKNLRHTHTQVIDCGGRTLLPGFCDTHFHLLSSAVSAATLDVSRQAKVHSIADLQTRIHEFSENVKPGAWIRAAGYNEFDLAERRHPTRSDLDQACRNHPVKLTHQTRHAHVLNTLALKQVGISRTTPDPPGALIDRSIGTGEPTGVLFEMNNFLSKRIPPLEESELNRGVDVVNQNLLSLGITSIHDASSHNEIKQWRSLGSWKEREKFLPRVAMMLGLQGFNKLDKNDFSCPQDKDQLSLKAVKIILDETTGQLYPPQLELNELVLKIHQAGMQVAIHAIEEPAVESAFKAIAYALKKSPKPDHRHRIEHCSVCSPALAKRLAALGIIVVTQPPFIYYNGDRYLKTVADPQIPYLYPIRTLQKNGVRVAGSSDAPVVPPNPLLGIYAAVTRMSENDAIVGVKECIEPWEALRMYTQDAAIATFDDTERGSITPGKLADMVVLSGDPTHLPPDEIKDLAVEMTVLDGKIVWNKMI
jgi:predicted amidohydrolase YtcJ